MLIIDNQFLDFYLDYIIVYLVSFTYHCVYTEQSCQVPLQDILNHTTKRIVSSIEILHNNECKDFEMLYKWGCDGYSNHSQYKQSFHTDISISDTSSFTVSLVRCEQQRKNCTLV
jgi:hypothetical protein